LKMRGDSGQTIVEVAVALAVVALLGGALVSIGIASVRSSSDAKMKAEATRMAEEAIEVARHTRDAKTTSTVQELLSIASSTGCARVSADFDLVEWSCDDPEVINGIFTRAITVADDSPEGQSDRVKITVTVTWGQGRPTERVEMTTYLSKWFSG
jgi:type II secretory pathway pseudopilin PulG